MGNILADLYVRDVQKALAFYRDVLDFEVKGEWTPEGQPTSWGHVNLGGCDVMFSSLHSACEGAYTQPPAFCKLLEENRWGVGVHFFVRHAVPDVDEYYGRVKAAGAHVVKEPETAPYGWRQFVVEDCDGYRLCFSNDA